MPKLLKTLAVLFLLYLFPFFSSNPALALLPYKNIKSVTFFDTPFVGGDFNQHFAEELPKIKAAGFNTVWFVLPWNRFNPKPLNNPPLYGDFSFTELKARLSLLKANNMQAILPLNYVGTNATAPEGIDSCSWTTDPVMYAAFETYVREFLTRIQEYSDMVYILIFTEGAEPCGMQSRPVYAATVSAILRPTIGSLPARLPAALRNKFKFGFHDYTLINLGWVTGDDSPIQSPIPYDFVSFTAYQLEDQNNQEIASEIETRASRFETIYPKTPIIVGEFGATSCNNQESNQTRVLSAIVNKALDSNYGFNLWGWRYKSPNPPANSYCTPEGGGGLSIINWDGSFKPSKNAVQSLLRPKVITNSVGPGVKAATLTGKNFSAFLKVQLFDHQNLWAERWVTTNSDYLSAGFSLPSTSPPSQCNLTQPCTITAKLYDRMSGLYSDPFSMILPKAPVPLSPVPSPEPLVNSLKYYAQRRNFNIGSEALLEQINNDATFSTILKEQFNVMTPGNELKFAAISPSFNYETNKPNYDFTKADEIVNFGISNGMKVRGHTLVWGTGLPDWLGDGSSFTDNQLKSILETHVRTVVRHFKGRLYAWDVVNEYYGTDGTPLPSVWNRIGNNYVELAFRWAREEDPNAKLFYNTLKYGEEWGNPLSQAIYDMAVDFRRRGVPIDGIGLQMHRSIIVNDQVHNKPPDLTALDQNIEKLGQVGLEVHITEMDLRDVFEGNSEQLNTQAQIYKDVLALCLAHQKCTSFSTWGFTDKYSWWNWEKPTPPPGVLRAPLIYDRNYNPKPAYYALLNELKDNPATPLPIPTISISPGPSFSPLPTVTLSPLAGDLNGDGKVDMLDYDIIITNFGVTGTNPADINNDNKVDIFDYNILVTNFGH